MISSLQNKKVSYDSKGKGSVTMNTANNSKKSTTASAAAALAALAARPSTVPPPAAKRGKKAKAQPTRGAGQGKEAEAKDPSPPEVQAKQPPPPPPPSVAAQGAGEAVPPAKAVVVDDVTKSVRELLETDLASESPTATKVGALRALAGHFRPTIEGSPAYARRYGSVRAVAQGDGCRKVLDVLRQELAKTGGRDAAGRPNRDVALGALRFLENWNGFSTEHRSDTSRHGGAAAIVGAMRAFPTSKGVQLRSLMCIRSLIAEDAGTERRLRELVEADAMLQASRAMQAHPRDLGLREVAIRILGCLREHGGDRVYDLYRSDAYPYLEWLCYTMFESDEPNSEELEFILRELVLQMLE
jgi:hypothetical protein